MMHASAPGKIVLTGEYAVLDGARAMVMAVDRRAVVTWQDDACAAPARDSAIVDAVFASGREPRRSGTALLDSEAFFASPDGSGRVQKLGLGSSAALVAALCCLLATDTVTASTPDLLFARALAAHREFQSGHGSGVDVAASVYGGVLCYRRDGSEIARASWPGGLLYETWWSGVPASTATQIVRLEESGDSPQRRSLAVAANDVASAWPELPARELLQELARYVEVLQHFDRRHALGIFSAGHGELAAAAAGTGAVYKPCGAGGGDIGMAFAHDRSSLAAFATHAMARGFRPLPLRLERHGAVRGEATA